MSRLIAAAGAAVLVVLGLASSAEAGTITLGNGVEGAGNRGGAFRTFSQERDRYVAPGSRFNHVVGTARSRGRDRRAFLFAQSWNGSHSNYDYTVGSGRSAGVQDAVWFLDNELGATRLNRLAGTAQTWVEEADGGVHVGGSWHRMGESVEHTPVLEPVPPGTGGPGNGIVMVPLPPAAFAGLSVLLGLGAARMRRRRAQKLTEAA